MRRDNVLAASVTDDTYEEVSETAERLGLAKAEVLRRALIESSVVDLEA